MPCGGTGGGGRGCLQEAPEGWARRREAEGLRHQVESVLRAEGTRLHLPADTLSQAHPPPL